jgi:hypothetical protein
MLNFDMVGKKPTFKIKKLSHHKTYLGVLLTTFIGIFTIFNSKDSIYSYVYRTYPQTSIEYMIDNTDLKFDFENKNPIMFSYAYLDADTLKIKYVSHDSSISSPIINYLDFE